MPIEESFNALARRACDPISLNKNGSKFFDWWEKLYKLIEKHGIIKGFQEVDKKLLDWEKKFGKNYGKDIPLIKERLYLLIYGQIIGSFRDSTEVLNRIVVFNQSNCSEFSFDKVYPIHLVTQYGNEEHLVKCLENGADINAEDVHQARPIHYAVEQQRAELVRVLIERGARLDGSNTKKAPLPLMRAVKKCTSGKGGDYAIVEMLVKAGANPNLPESNPPLSYALSSSSRSRLIALLLEAGANPNIPCIFFDSNTLLQQAATRGHADIVKLLIDYGAEIEVSDKNGKTPLYLAEESGNEEVVQILKSAKAKKAPRKEASIHKRILDIRKAITDHVAKRQTKLPDSSTKNVFISIVDDVIAYIAEEEIVVTHLDQSAQTKRLMGHSNKVTGLLTLTDKFIASTSRDKTIRIWDIQTGTCIQMIETNTSDVWIHGTLSDGYLIGSLDIYKETDSNNKRYSHTSFQVWDPDTGKPILETPYSGGVIALAKDGKLIAVSESHRYISIWEYVGNNIRPSKTILDLSKDVPSYAMLKCAVFLPHGRLACGFTGYVLVMDINSGRCLLKIDIGLPATVNCIGLTPDNKIVIGGDLHRVMKGIIPDNFDPNVDVIGVIDPAARSSKKKLLQTVDTPVLFNADSFVILPDGRMVNEEGETFDFAGTAKGKEVAESKFTRAQEITLQVSSDSNFGVDYLFTTKMGLITCSLYRKGKEYCRRLHIWRVSDGQCIKEIDVPKGDIKGAVKISDEFIAFGIESNIHIFDINNTTWLRKFSTGHKRSFNMTVAKHGQLMSFSNMVTTVQEIKIWDENGKCIQRYRMWDFDNITPFDCNVMNDQQFAVVSVEGISIFKIGGYFILKQRKVKGIFSGVYYLENSNELLTIKYIKHKASKRDIYCIQIWNAINLSCTKQFELPLGVSPTPDTTQIWNGEYIVFGVEKNSILGVFNISTGHFDQVPLPSEAISLAILPEGNIACGLSDGKVSIFNLSATLSLDKQSIPDERETLSMSSAISAQGIFSSSTSSTSPLPTIEAETEDAPQKTEQEVPKV